jgi:coniferyl-aldehyde dehydrogenase
MTDIIDKNTMKTLLKRQRDAFNKAGFPSLDIRLNRLERLRTMLKKYDERICMAVAEDFGTRPPELTRLSEVFTTVEHTKDAIASIAQWMKPDQRQAPYPACEAGATAEVRYLPKGVVGIIGPWNFPVHLVLAPLVCVLAAGNRAMIKPSELTPKTAQLIEEMISEFFDETEVVVVQGDAQTAEAFTQLPFDHIMFTGSTAVGRHVMRAAANNLTPVTLELGGKSPVVIDKEVDLKTVATRLITGKLFNSGQVCVCPDYAFVPEELLAPLLEQMERATKTLYPSIADNPEYTAIINDNHYQRLQRLVDDARQQGVEVIELNPAGEEYDQALNRKMLPKILLNPADEVAIMQSEIFGPLLPIKTYHNLNEVTDYINNHDRPLALYYFGDNETNQAHFVDNVIAGGMTINDVVVQVICNSLPFGGTGPSGIGCYHGIDGFREFSHLKGVYSQTPAEEVAGFMRPPYSDAMREMMEHQIAEG